MVTDGDVTLRLKISQPLYDELESLRKEKGMLQYCMLRLAIEEYVERQTTPVRTSTTEPLQ